MKFLKDFTTKIGKIRLFKNNCHVFRSLIKFQKLNFSNIIIKKNNSSLPTFGNISKICKIGTFQRNIFTIFLKLLNIYLFSKIFQKVKISMLR